MAVQTGLCRTWSETPKTGFLRTRLICLRIYENQRRRTAALSRILISVFVFRCLDSIIFLVLILIDPIIVAAILEDLRCDVPELGLVAEYETEQAGVSGFLWTVP